ncbi:hypothetical protein CcaCcLH18_04375 [Colletotrichum camelliae]|nr:hypothetical protein CcaCcLH18_04375 [Colletotrichum camelliae]
MDKCIVQKAADLAFSPAMIRLSRFSLATVLGDCIDGWNHTGDQHLFAPTPNMTIKQSQLIEVHAFMSDLARTFPAIHIEESRAIGGCAAKTHRRNWQQPFNANASCTMSVNKKLLTAARNAGRIAIDPSTSLRDRDRAIESWANSLLELSVAIAHEFAHLLTGRMIGGGPGRPNTPILVHHDIDEISKYTGAVLSQAEDYWILDPNRDFAQIPHTLRAKMYGEAGVAWEGLLFKGRLMFISDSALRLNGASRDLSAGVPWFV